MGCNTAGEGGNRHISKTNGKRTCEVSVKRRTSA